VELFL
jgi:CheY-like chemotaxis protein